MATYTWVLDGRWGKTGPPNAHQLARDAQLSYPVAGRVLRNEPMARIDADTHTRLAKYFRIKKGKEMSLVRLHVDG